MAELQKINIIFEDNHLLVVEKPINIPVCGDSSGDMDLLSILKKYIKARFLFVSTNSFLHEMGKFPNPFIFLLRNLFIRDIIKNKIRRCEDVKNKRYRKIYR